MSTILTITLIAGYFRFLIVISFLTSKNADNDAFFIANKKSPWYLVAFGMIGASLSGVTFISVPGWVENSSLGYMQVVLGYTLGYWVIGTVLLPLYYKLNLTSIYGYLESRFGFYSYKTGALFFIISRLIGASFRLFLVANVFQLFLFDAIGVEFWQTVTITILLIWLYTYKSGIKTIIWTDSLQTLFMLTALGVTIVYVSGDLNLSLSTLTEFINQSEFSQIFFFNDYKSSNFFWKQFLSGAFIAIVMTGLDQDMMQKNLTCKTLKEAQKNMFWFTLILTVVNFIFLILGLLLTEYAQLNGFDIHKDNLFPFLAKNHLGTTVYIFFLLGLIAAAYSSADSALTSLTTSFSIDIIDIKNKYALNKQEAIRKRIHVLMSFILVLIIIAFKYIIKNESVIERLFVFAGYTYGPLLGYYSFGLFTKLKIKDKLSPYIAITAPILSYVLSVLCESLLDFEFGFFILVLNGAIMFLGLLFIKKR